MSETKSIEQLREEWIRTRRHAALRAWSEAVGREAEAVHQEFLRAVGNEELPANHANGRESERAMA